MKISSNTSDLQPSAAERRSTGPKPGARQETQRAYTEDLIVEISKENKLASQNKVENVFDAATLLKDVEQFITNNGKEALYAQGNLRENRVKDLLDLT